MKFGMSRIVGVLGALVLTTSVSGQVFDFGSDGSYGAIDIQVDTTLDMPPDGIFHATTINVAIGATLTFNKNPLNTPVYLLATGDVSIDGFISVEGSNGTATPPLGGKGGPGGFNGGMPGAGTETPPSAGHGPGAGLANFETYGGYGGYGKAGWNRSYDGQPYGSPLLIPLVGGSGGGGQRGDLGSAKGGGGGGGAILVASNTRIDIPSSAWISANGGTGASATGSGGAIRIVAPIVAGGGKLHVEGWTNSPGDFTGAGRIRIDTIDRSSLGVVSVPSDASTIGSVMTAFRNVIPRLDIISAAGTAIPEGNADPVFVVLPLDSPTMQQVTVQARDFTGLVPIDILLTPESGDPIKISTEIDMGTGNPASVTIDIDFPVNTVVRVTAWTR
jgi:hypothetical protein